MASGAHVTSGGVWRNASSKEYKKDIHELTTEEQPENPADDGLVLKASLE
jgi:hypothetical protein